jgi:hypothetical protein
MNCVRKWGGNLMASAPPVGRNSLATVGLCLLIEYLAACGSLPPSATSICDPREAREVLSVDVRNSSQQTLTDFPVAVSLDERIFDFAIPAKDGSNLAVWDAATTQPLPVWVESYDPAAGKALLWFKLPSVGPQLSQKVLLTAGAMTSCDALPSSGYTVFPFFSDVKDVSAWHATNNLSVTNSTTKGPITITNRSVIQSDRTYNGFPGVVQAGNGDFVLSYKKGTNHVDSQLVVIRRSSDAGTTWSPEIVYFNAALPDPALVQTPSGDLLIALGKANQDGIETGAYSRSSDNGLTWGTFTFFQDPPLDTILMDPMLNIGSTMYGTGYGPFQNGTGEAPSLWLSVDDGFTWTQRSHLRLPGEPGLNETAIAYTAPDTLFAMMRTDSGLETFGRYSGDMGMSWEPLRSYTSQVGVLQFPMMAQAGPAIILLGREAMAIPGVQPANTIGYPRQLVAFVSSDGGQTFGYGIVLDQYTGQVVDGGYSWPILLADGQVYVVYYADSHDLRKPDIKSVTLSVTPPSTLPANSIHVLSQLAPGIATHAMNLNSTRYALEFRFRSYPTPAAGQFSVLLQGQVSGVPSMLVNWELPSTHGADPTSDSGFFSGEKFVPVLDTFSYGQLYRLRTIVDEAQSTQQASVLDEFGGLIESSPPMPFAQEGSHATMIQIGNNSSLRATDTLLDFVFVRPAALVEPTVLITRMH